jgi:hypothetical protein
LLWLACGRLLLVLSVPLRGRRLQRLFNVNVLVPAIRAVVVTVPVQADYNVNVRSVANSLPPPPLLPQTRALTSLCIPRDPSLVPRKVANRAMPKDRLPLWPGAGEQLKAAAPALGSSFVACSIVSVPMSPLNGCISTPWHARAMHIHLTCFSVKMSVDRSVETCLGEIALSC